MESKPRVLVTGATGYIGSHTVCDLVSKGFGVVLLDNLKNSTDKVIPQIAKITGKPELELPFFKCDVRDRSAVEGVFEQCRAQGNPIEAVIHFAALKAVGDSVKWPLDYYETNLVGTLNLLRAMAKHSCAHLIFSSSACVYGNGNRKCTETDPTHTLNPYGSTKLFCEKMIAEFCASEEGGAW